jgi:hypothetical protein
MMDREYALFLAFQSTGYDRKNQRQANFEHWLFSTPTQQPPQHPFHALALVPVSQQRQHNIPIACALLKLVHGVDQRLGYIAGAQAGGGDGDLHFDGAVNVNRAGAAGRKRQKNKHHHDQ